MRALLAAALAGFLLIALGCGAHHRQVTRVATTNARPATTTVEETQERSPDNQQRIGEVDLKAEAVAKSAAAQAASAQAPGDTEVREKRLVQEVVLSEDQGNFKFGKAALPDETRVRLGDLANQLKAAPTTTYIEIEGHTD